MKTVDEIKQECLDEMTEVCKKHSAETDDPEEFEMLILEQWRPW